VGTRKDSAALRQIRTLYDDGVTGDLTDGQLLERFATGRGEAAERAFSALVERHGAMVLRVCRARLPDPHDTQDAFQATFLVLVEKARSLWVQDSLGPWLHQVALRTASFARSSDARRRRHERRAAEMARFVADGGVDLEGPERVLHEEIDRLPERYRVPIVLCDLEGRSHEQAARHLGWPVGTVKSRQARGRERLRDRLTRRGLAPTAGSAAWLAAAAARAGVPAPLVFSTASAAVDLLTARALARGSAGLLAKEVLRAMSMTRWGKAASMLFALAATAGGVPLLARIGAQNVEAPPGVNAPAARADEKPVAEVKRGKLTVTINERGNIEASRSADVYCQVEGQTTIIMIVPEGTRVKQGEIVCELDSAALKDQLTNQEIAARAADSAYRRARVNREVAEVAVTEYVEGVYTQNFQAARGEIVLAEAAIKKAEERVARLRDARARMKNTLAGRERSATPTDIAAEVDLDDRLADAEESLLRTKVALELAQTRLNVLQKFTRDKTVNELKSEVERRRSEELAKQATWDLEKSKEAKLRRQIANCVIKAPNDGIVVYANDPNRFGVRNAPQIEEGATVRERQKIISIPDLTSFVVNTKVREAVVDKLQPGQRAKVTVDAFPGEVLTGTVRQIAPLPDPSTFFNSDVKVYSTRVELDKPLPGLRPGMTASAEILITERDDVLSVPIRAVATYGGKDHVAVKKPDGGVEWREATLGVATLGNTDDEVVEVKEGLKAGESVAVNPVSLMTEQEKREKFGTPTPKPTMPAAKKARGAGASKGKGAAAALPAALRQKLLTLTPEDRAKLKSGSPDEREALFKKAGFTDDEVRQLKALRPPLFGPR
jgi:RND family efflux transporter MFP subunit